MIRRVIREEGSALVIAMMVMALMISVGMAALSFTDRQQAHSATERVRESAFNLAEGALQNQLLLVTRSWPGNAASAFPTSCTSASSVTNCPDPATVMGQFNGADYQSSSYTTKVQDDGGDVKEFYDTQLAQGEPSYDQNGDGELWIRSEGVARGQTRIVVTKVKADVVPIPFPHNTVTSGFFGTTNNGNKVIVDTNGSTYATDAGYPGAIAVRCDDPPTSACLNYSTSKGQVSPPIAETNYPTPTAVPPDALKAMRGMAKSANTYYETGCPANPAGALVFIENANCTFNGGVHNSLSVPGMVVIATGTFTLAGNAQYHGLIYAANLQGSTGNVVSLQGNSQLVGAVAVDGAGGVSAGSSGTNVVYSPNVFNLVKGYGTANVMRGTWRELRN